MGVEHPDWLPRDWKIKVRIRNNGKRDKYYIDPSTGLTYKSQPEVLRYLKSSGKSEISKSIGVKQHDMKKAGENTAVAANLPPGWIKKIRTTKKNGCKTRRDAYYIDPESGNYFRSIPEVLRYLHSNDTGKIKKQEDSPAKAKTRVLVDKKRYKNRASIIKPGKKLEDGVKRSDRDTINATPKQQLEKNDDSLECDILDNDNEAIQLVKNKVDMNVILDHRLRSGSKAVALKTVNFLDEKRNDKGKKSVHANLSNKSPQVNEKNEQQCGRRKSMRLHEIKHSGSDNIGVTRIRPRSYPTEDDKELEILLRKKKIKTSRGKCFVNEMPLRTSKRLAILKNEANSSNEATADAENIKSKPRMNPRKLCVLQGQAKSNMGKCVAVEDSSCTKERKDNTAKNGEKQEKASCSSLNDLLMDPCIEFAVKTLTGAIPIEDVKNFGSSSVSSQDCASALPSSNIWSDPCFEFAVKTLTGEIPMVDVSNLVFSSRP